jgi:hypothetical protein
MRISVGKFWKLVIIPLVVAAVISQLYYVHLWNVYYDTLPHSPDEVVGRVYTDNFHGFVRYETREEHFRLHAIDYLSEGLAFIAVLATVAHEWKLRRGRERRKELG